MARLWLPQNDWKWCGAQRRIDTEIRGFISLKLWIRRAKKLKQATTWCRLFTLPYTLHSFISSSWIHAHVAIEMWKYAYYESIPWSNYGYRMICKCHSLLVHYPLRLRKAYKFKGNTTLTERTCNIHWFVIYTDH